MRGRDESVTWPALPYDPWKETCETLHLWLQIVGKVRLTQSPWVNHAWHSTFYVTATGLTTSLIPHGTELFQIDFDFLDHQLVVQSATRGSRRLPLKKQSVADFYTRLMKELDDVGLPVKIHGRPNETAAPVPFAGDSAPRPYDAEAVTRYWRALLQATRVFSQFRSRFIGKCSPVHLFWGAPDLAVTRFSGRQAPEHPGGIPNLPDKVTREAYSHEVSSCGFWAGNAAMPYPAFYAYGYPEPAGFSSAPVQPAAAFYDQTFREFILPYDAVRESSAPDETLLAFLQSTYEAVATLGKWDRPGLEREKLP